MSNDKKIVVYKDENLSAPEDADDFLAFFIEKIASIPAEFRASAYIELEADERWGAAYIGVEISYRRPESEEDIQKRKRLEEEQAAEREKRQLDTYNRLKKIYEDK